jgi:hypothetical protein
MAVKVDDFGQTGRIETNPKPAQSTKSTSNKKTEENNVFQALLSAFKPKENSQPVDNLRNRPASSQVIKNDPHKPTKIPGPARGLNGQNVNNLAASALIAMAAISSGPNRISGFSTPGAGQCALSAMTSGFAGVSASGSSLSTRLCPGQEIGTLSAYFESGEKGPGVVGYDSNGGTSYGTYQISSRAGTMSMFIDYLSERAPDLASKLKAAGPSNTGSRSGKMPEVWKKIAATDPNRFAKLQYDFIEQTHYLPALQEISQRTGLDVSKAPRALQEVLWSTAVQHGPKGAVKIFTKAIGHAQDKHGVKTAQLIGSVYAMRANQFSSAGSDLRAAARSRFKEEGRLALAMLSDPFLNTGSVRG